MDNKNKQQPRKKKKGGGLGLLILLAIWLIRSADEGALRRLFARLRWKINTGSINSRAAISAIAVVCALFAIIICVSVLAKKAKDKRFDGIRRSPGGSAARGGASSVSPMSGQSTQHSHDRLSGYHGEENGYDHWKKQLDGFLEAGIIDRSEYRALLERRRR